MYFLYRQPNGVLNLARWAIHMPLMLACYKGDSSVQETQQTQVTTTTIDERAIDESRLTIDAPESRQTGVIKVSNVESGAAVNLSITNEGLSGDDIEGLLDPLTDALTSISSDVSRSSSATAAVSASVSDAIDGAGNFVRDISDTVGDVLTGFMDNTKRVLQNPGVQLVVGGGVLLLLTSRRKK